MTKVRCMRWLVNPVSNSRKASLLHMWGAMFSLLAIGIAWLSSAAAPARAEGEPGLTSIPREQLDFAIGVVAGLGALALAGGLVVLARRRKR